MSAAPGVNATSPRSVMTAGPRSEGRERVQFTAKTDLRRVQRRPSGSPHPGGPDGHGTEPLVRGERSATGSNIEGPSEKEGCR